MKFDVKDEKNCKKVISVTVSKEKVSEAYKKVFEEVKNNAKLDGYRKGKVPEDMVKKLYEGTINEEVLKEVVPATYSKILEQLDLHIVTNPTISELGYGDDKKETVAYKIIVEINPEFELKDYTKMKFKKKELKNVTEEDIERELNRIRQYRGELKDSDADKVKDKDFATVELAGFVEGKAEAGLTTPNQLIQVGGGTHLQELEDGIKGMKPGQEKDVNFKFPADYHKKEFAGKNGVFKVKVKGIKTLVLPELNDDFVKGLGGFNTVAELKAAIRKELEKQAEVDLKNYRTSEIIKNLADAHSFEVPQGLVEQELQNIVARYQNTLGRQGLTLEKAGLTVEGIKEKNVKQAEANIRLIYVLRKIAEQEKLDITDADVEAEIRKISAETKEDAETMIKQAKARGNWDALKAKLLEDKVFDRLASMMEK